MIGQIGGRETGAAGHLRSSRYRPAACWRSERAGSYLKRRGKLTSVAFPQTLLQYWCQGSEPHRRFILFFPTEILGLSGRTVAPQQEDSRLVFLSLSDFHIWFSSVSFQMLKTSILYQTEISWIAPSWCSHWKPTGIGVSTLSKNGLKTLGGKIRVIHCWIICICIQMYVDAPKGETIPPVVWTFSLPGLTVYLDVKMKAQISFNVAQCAHVTYENNEERGSAKK